MISYIQVVTLLAKATHGFFRISKELEACKVSHDYLISRYNLSQPEVYNHAGFVSYTHRGYSEDWEILFRRLVGTISSHELDDSVYQTCGELAMFTLSMTTGAKVSSVRERDIWSIPKSDIFYSLYRLKKTDTYALLVQMGNGLGSDYTRRLIVDGLKKWAAETGVVLGS